MFLTDEQKIGIAKKVLDFAQAEGLNKNGKITVLLKVQNPELLKNEDDFFESLETRLRNLTGIKPSWLVGGIENKNLWIGMAVLEGAVKDTLIFHDRGYEFVVVI